MHKDNKAWLAVSIPIMVYPGWALGLVLAYILRCIQNRAQSVKTKLHTWCNPMETSLNMNPSPTRLHIAYKHP